MNKILDSGPCVAIQKEKRLCCLFFFRIVMTTKTTKNILFRFFVFCWPSHVTKRTIVANGLNKEMLLIFFNLELVNRGCQTQATLSKYQQMGRDVATQTAVPGIHISTKNDYVIMSGDYRVSTEYRKLQIMAVRFHFINYFQNFRITM